MNPTFDGAELYSNRYGTSPTSASKAPGRVEILGNHTDYNGGYVLTVALDKIITIHGERMEEPFVTVYTSVLDDETRFPIEELSQDPSHPWANYVKGVLYELKQAGKEFGGFRAVISGNLPIGAGVSSSAALETAVALFVQSLYPYEIERMELAKLCQRAENHFVGMPCGILDQFSSIFGQESAMLFLDCDTLAHKILSLPSPAPALVLCNTHVKHELIEGKYKTRRRQCEAAAQTLSEHLGRPLRFLRDISLLEFTDLEDTLDHVFRCRARHVLKENQRVLHGVAALQLQDISHLGELMRLSHESSRDLFDNSCEELDVLVEEAYKIPGCFGAKLTGGGFGGATVNIVEHDRVEAFTEEIKRRYTERVGKECETMVCEIGEGAKIIQL